jgi:hypothetical protein
MITQMNSVRLRSCPAYEVPADNYFRMARYAQLLFNHFLQLENLNSTFDRVFPLLEELSSEESKGFISVF